MEDAKAFADARKIVDNKVESPRKNKLLVTGSNRHVLRQRDDARSAMPVAAQGKKWFRYDAPDKQLFKQLQKTLMASAA